MENQHRKISGYRELSQEEIDLMNRIKAKGAEMLELQEELVDLLGHKAQGLVDGASDSDGDTAELDRFYGAEPFKWADIGKTDIQTGVMALVRAVAQPAGGI